VLLSQLQAGELPHEPFWRPLEATLEDKVLLPLLDAAGVYTQRQVMVTPPGSGASRRGRIDLLLFEHPAAEPFSLIETKRLLGSERDLQAAVQQANAYAQARWLASFLVAAPSGLWVYHRSPNGPRCVQSLTSLAIHQRPASVARLLQKLARAHR
jgi:hypothetical protein